MRNSIRRVCQVGSEVEIPCRRGSLRRRARRSGRRASPASGAARRCRRTRSRSRPRCAAEERAQPGRRLQRDRGRKRRGLVRGVAEEQQRDLAGAAGPGRSRRPPAIERVVMRPGPSAARPSVRGAARRRRPRYPASAAHRSARCCANSAVLRSFSGSCSCALAIASSVTRGVGAQARKPRSRASDPARCSRIAASAASARPARIAVTMRSCCAFECSMLRGSSGNVSSHALTRARFSAASATSDGMPASSAIVRCSSVSSRR